MVKTDKPEETKLSAKSAYSYGTGRSAAWGKSGGTVVVAGVQGAAKADDKDDKDEVVDKAKDDSSSDDERFAGMDALFSDGGGWGGGGGWTSAWGGGAAKSDSVSADFREGDEDTFKMPDNIELVGAKLEFDEGDDGAMALVSPATAKPCVVNCARTLRECQSVIALFSCSRSRR